MNTRSDATPVPKGCLFDCASVKWFQGIPGGASPSSSSLRTVVAKVDSLVPPGHSGVAAGRTARTAWRVGCGLCAMGSRPSARAAGFKPRCPPRSYRRHTVLIAQRAVPQLAGALPSLATRSHCRLAGCCVARQALPDRLGRDLVLDHSQHQVVQRRFVFWRVPSADPALVVRWTHAPAAWH